ncbi:MAG: hypothetical protein K9M96_07555 [Deltaproteobacteria bacterium]|nr:hypothetical protein [Deltaproteobacteria bacterium]MCF8120706.1 hypothetical protein [Deltaproteobacteria bacterium]
MINIDWSAVGSIGTALAVLVAAWQVRKNTQQAKTDFEDDLSREYRELARSIPVKAHLGQELEDDEFEEAYPSLYRYIDLSNEQVFLRMNGRISKATWRNWADGIKSNLHRPAFADAWKRVKKGASGSFDELRSLEQSGFSDDPHKWVPLRKRVWHC